MEEGDGQAKRKREEGKDKQGLAQSLPLFASFAHEMLSKPDEISWQDAWIVRV
jgi:hypothetical protein